MNRIMFMKSKDLTSSNSNNSALDFEKLFNVCRIALGVCGIIAIDSIFSKSARRISDLKGFYYIFGILPVIFVVICETRCIVHYWGSDIYLALEACTTVLTGVVVLVQGFWMYYSRKEFLHLISEIHDLWKKQLAINVKSSIVKKVKSAQLYTRMYAVMVLLLASSYTLRPYCLLLAHVISNKNETFDFSQTAYNAIYPFTIDSVNKYLLCISGELLVLVIVGAWWIASDMVYLQLMTHLALQYQILNDDLIPIQTGDNSSTPNDNISIQQLNSIGKRHAHLLQLSKDLKKIFSPILLALMLVTSANICICIINIQGELRNQNIAGVIKRVMYALITMIQPAIYCIYANDLTEWADGSAAAAYECDWVAGTQNFKKSVRLITMRAQKGVKFRIYGFFNVDLNELTQIGVTAARFFAIINSLS